MYFGGGFETIFYCILRDRWKNLRGRFENLRGRFGFSKQFGKNTDYIFLLTSHKQ